MILKKVFWIGLPLPLLCTACASPAPETITKTVWAMDTACTMTLQGGDTAEISKLLTELDSIFDNYSSDSDISRLNQTGTLSAVPQLFALTEQTLALNTRFGADVDITSGALTTLWGIATDTPHVPSQQELDTVLPTISPSHVRAEDGTLTLSDGAQLDAGAVAKGFALDCIKAQLDDAGNTTYGTISMTSSILFYGEKPDGMPFTVSIRDPDGAGTLGTVKTEACFLSTSGGYERYFTADDGNEYGHILDLTTGMPADSDLTTVTVFCDSGLQSDFLSTLIWREGTQQIDRHLQAEDYKIVAQDTAGNLYVSDGLQFEEK